MENDSPIIKRLIKSTIDLSLNKASIENAIFQHSVLCQTFLPYRDPGKEVTLWMRQQGHAKLAIQVMQQENPKTGEFEYPGLPFGTKGRLILMHLNNQAVKKQSAIIDVDETVTGFLKSMGLPKTGRTLDSIKEQLKRINSSVVSISYQKMQADLKIVKAFDVSFQKSDTQRLLWNSTIVLAEDYFKNLIDHAVPLDVRAMMAISHNAMAMDIYAWLVQRLHRIDPKSPQFIDWANMKAQFGPEFKQMKKFKEVFRVAFKQVQSQYSKARVEEVDNKGLRLHHSPSVIESKPVILLK